MFAINVAAGAAVGPLDYRRHGIERMPPDIYVRSSYYEKWLARMELLVAETGVLDRAPAHSAQSPDEFERIVYAGRPAESRRRTHDAAFRGWRSRPRAQFEPDRPHAPAALRARPHRRDPPAARHARLSPIRTRTARARTRNRSTTCASRQPSSGDRLRRRATVSISISGKTTSSLVRPVDVRARRTAESVPSAAPHGRRDTRARRTSRETRARTDGPRHRDARDARPRRRSLRARYRTDERRARRRARVARSGLQSAIARRRDSGDCRARFLGTPGRAHGRRREHARRAQRRRLHAVLVLSMAGAGFAADVVQEPGVSIARRHRSARRTCRLRPDDPRRRRDPCLGLERRDTLSGAARTASRTPTRWTRTRSPRSSRAMR